MEGARFVHVDGRGDLGMDVEGGGRGGECRGDSEDGFLALGRGVAGGRGEEVSVGEFGVEALAGGEDVAMLQAAALHEVEDLHAGEAHFTRLGAVTD